AQAASLHPHHPRSPRKHFPEPPSRRSILPMRRPSPTLQLSSPLSFPIGPWGPLVRALFGDRAGLMRAAFGWARRLNRRRKGDEVRERIEGNGFGRAQLRVASEDAPPFPLAGRGTTKIAIGIRAVGV